MHLRTLAAVFILTSGCALGSAGESPAEVAPEAATHDEDTAIAVDSGNAEGDASPEDTSVIDPPADAPPPAAKKGIPFGPSGLWETTTSIHAVGSASFTASVDGVTAATLVDRLAAARKKGLRILINMTGGGHENYLTDGVFDLAKWRARMDTYNTPAIKAAVAAAVADGTITGNSVMDEPHVSGGGDGNTWGPPGTMTKARVDDLCSYVKKMFPTLQVGVAHGHDVFEPTKSYKVCEFIIAQYSVRKGDVMAWRDAALAMGKRDGHAIAFSINILSGGEQAERDGKWDCPLTTTGGRGTYEPNCRMTAAQVLAFGKVLGPAGCVFNMWRYDDSFMSKADNQKAFADLATLLAAAPAKECRRP
jgi:hypothetical protein